MDESSPLEQELQSLVDEQVVVDVKHSHIYIGTLVAVGPESLVLRDCDVHFFGDSSTTSELYLVDAKKTGVRPNRRIVYVMLKEVLSVALLEDIIEY